MITTASATPGATPLATLPPPPAADAALIPVTVLACERLPGEVLHLTLGRADGSPLPAAEPGAHIDLHLPGAPVRQYSLCAAESNAPGQYEVGVLRTADSRGGSKAIHERLRPGLALQISHPRNLFALAAPTGESGHVRLIAGGIGITPLLAMAQRLHAQGRPFTLHYAVRSRTLAAYAARLAASPFAACVRLHADDGERFDFARDVGTAGAADQLYLCGPAGFMQAVETAAAAHGWLPAQVHTEHFQAAPAAPAADDPPFEVLAARSQVCVVVPPGRTISEVLREAGVDVWTSCEQGVCGTCLTTLLEGEADHRDRYQTAAEQAAQDQIALCCSRARSARLVIDA